MTTRRNILKASAAGLAGAVAAPIGALSASREGFAGKYIPTHLYVEHCFSPYLRVCNMDTGEIIQGVTEIDVKQGLLKKFIFERREVYQNNVPAKGKDIFGYYRPRIASRIKLDEQGNVITEYVYGRFELNWECGEVPAHILEMKKKLSRKEWEEVCKHGKY